jgi:DNA-binding NarL/FixJ family response regulator
MKPNKDTFVAPSRVEPALLLSKSDSRYWKARLIRRSYTDAIKLVRGQEYSTRIEHGGVSFFFPLGSVDEDRAAVRAIQIYSTIANEGWQAAFDRFPREITVAVFWGWNPMACTYTTLYSMPSESLSRVKPARPAVKRSCRVSVIEPEEGVRRAFALWIDRQPGFCCPQSFASVQQAAGHLRADSAQLVLVNRDLIERPGGDKMETIRGLVPEVPVFSFGVYEESNYIFHSVTGVPAGYFLLRRQPRHLFDAISPLARQPKLPLRLLMREIEKYFQSLFDLPDREVMDQELANLTNREREILLCLSKGFSDKQIADALNISVWTVHGHVKNVFEKLGVHSRTEAVIKFLQK